MLTAHELDIAVEIRALRAQPTDNSPIYQQI